MESVVASIASICQVSERRAQELVEATNGSLERAIELYFCQQEKERPASNVSVDDDKSTALADLQGVEESPILEICDSDGKQPNNSSSPSSYDPIKMKKKRSPASQGDPTSSSPSKPGSEKQRKLDAFFRRSSGATREPIRYVADGLIAKPEKKEETLSCQEIEVANISQVDNNHNNNPTVALSADPAQMANPNDTSPVVVLANMLQQQIGDSLEFAFLATKFADMVATTKRTSKLNSLKEIFRHVVTHVGGIHDEYPRQDDAKLLVCTLDLTLGKLSTVAGPMQVSGAAVSKAVQTVTNASAKQMREVYRRTGDLGDVAAELFIPAQSARRFFIAKKESAAHSIRQVHALMESIATVPTGKGSQAARQTLLIKLLRGCKEKEEVRFLVRLLIGNMRLGATEKTVLAALAVVIDEASHCKEGKSSANLDVTDILQNTFNVCPRMGEIALALLRRGVRFAAEVCSIEVGCPVQPMLANPAHSLEQVAKFMQGERAVAEWKMDGVRCQAHWDGKSVKLFSRHLLDQSNQYPDAVQYLLDAKHPTVESFILDAEIVGVAPSAESDGGFRFLPFQDLSTRRGLKAETINRIQIRIYSFDLLYLNGSSLLNLPQWQRQEQLRKSFRETVGFGYVTRVELPQYDEAHVQGALQRAVRDGAEGLMIKLTGQPSDDTDQDTTPIRTYGYESGTRSQLWLKLKRDYVAGFADTIDVVPIGAWYGSGRKAEKGFLSPVLLAVYDDEEGVFRSVSRCMSFTDEMYLAMREFYFHGTPYPAHVGVEPSDQPETKEEKAAPDIDAKDDDSDEGETTGFRDEDYEGESFINETVPQNRVNCFSARPPSSLIVTNESPSIWFKPLEVFEVSFADLSLSRAHTAAAGLIHHDGAGDDRGIALRFPRFKRRRPDKTVEQATTSAQMAQLFHQQSKFHHKSSR